MMRSYIHAAWLAGLLLGGGCRKAPAPASAPLADAVVAAPPAAPAPAAADAAQGIPDGATANPGAPRDGAVAAGAAYVLDDGKERQALTVVDTKKGIDFTLERSGSCTLKLAGSAEREAEGELFTDADDMPAYTADTYAYGGKEGCRLLIIENRENAGRMRLALEHCKTECPLLDGVMIRPAR